MRDTFKSNAIYQSDYSGLAGSRDTTANGINDLRMTSELNPIGEDNRESVTTGRSGGYNSSLIKSTMEVDYGRASILDRTKVSKKSKTQSAKERKLEE